LRWDTTLAEAMPEYPDQAAAGKITVWQLLHHTAGLGDFFVPEFFQNRETFNDPADYLDLIARQPTLFEPGADWSYSNAGYILLGRIIENASGKGYFDYIQQHVFAPAGMTASGFDTQEDVTPKLATGYFREGAFATTWKANWMTLPFKGSPAGGGYSTNADLLRFASALHGERLVGKATLAAMFADGVPIGPGTYAAGFGDRLSHGRHIRGHAGGAPGMSANLAIAWETGATVAITSNQGDTPTAMLLSERIADLLAAQEPAP
jgi:D-alanyl-D-alanine carboxypeptidase